MRETELQLHLAGEVCIEVEASGVTFADIMTCKGKPHLGSPHIPVVPGFEIAGRIIQVGTDVEQLGLGQRVIAIVHSGGYSSHICIEAWRCIPIPDQMDVVHAVALLVNYWTAWYLLHRASPLQQGQRVLIRSNDIAGAVGEPNL